MIEVNMTEETKTQQTEFGFQAEMQQLLHLIIHSLYSHKEIFLRELVSNASDAINKLRIHSLTDDLGDLGELKIEIKSDEKAGTLTVSDNGIGMTKQELIEHLGTIAKSGTKKFLQEMASSDSQKQGDLIGQFGVGFYSAFMVAAEVSVESKSYKKDEPAFRWSSAGTGSYTIEECKKEERGTTITLTLKAEEKEYSQEHKVREILNKYSNFVEYPLYLGEEHVNKTTALWRKQSSKVTPEEVTEFYKYLTHDFTEPVGHLHVQAEAPISYSALLFFPKKNPFDLMQKPDEFHIQLYIKKVFIQGECRDLLPPYLRFVKGVVDSDDLDLNVSRETVQHSPVIAKIKKTLTGKILRTLEEWAEKEKDKYLEFYKNNGNILKEGVDSDYENKDKIVKLMRFKTSKSGDQWISLSEYLDRKKETQDKIYYSTGRSVELIAKNPNMEYFHDKDIEVLYVTELIDEYLMPVIAKFEDIEIVSIDSSDTLKDEKEVEISDDQKKFLEYLKTSLGENLEDVRSSQRLSQSPCTLINTTGGMNPHMEAMMKAMNPDYKEPKKIWEVNLTHPLMTKLAALYAGQGESAELKKAVETLYAASLQRIDKLEDSEQYVSNLYEYMEKAIG